MSRLATTCRVGDTWICRLHCSLGRKSSQLSPTRPWDFTNGRFVYVLLACKEGRASGSRTQRLGRFSGRIPLPCSLGHLHTFSLLKTAPMHPYLNYMHDRKWRPCIPAIVEVKQHVGIRTTVSPHTRGILSFLNYSCLIPMRRTPKGSVCRHRFTGSYPLCFILLDHCTITASVAVDLQHA